MIGVLTTFCVALVLCPMIASSAEEEAERQEVLVECPTWHWGASQIPGVVYELCFDDIDQCAEANIGDEVCIPDMGQHEVWVTAIDFQGADPIYYDGEISAINRIGNADFNNSGLVGFDDVMALIEDFGRTGERPTDLNEDGIVSLGDFFVMIDAFGKCVSDTGYLYEAC